VFALTGKVANCGLIGVSMGAPLRRIIFDIGRGIIDGARFKAVQTGGPSGGCLPEDFLDIPVDFENLAKAGFHIRIVFFPCTARSMSKIAENISYILPEAPSFTPTLWQSRPPPFFRFLAPFAAF